VAERLGISEQAVANHKHFTVTKLKDAAKKARLRNFDPSNFGII
jgi:RNA polymerase sigma-70 factor (ECF subfamily)